MHNKFYVSLMILAVAFLSACDNQSATSKSTANRSTVKPVVKTGIAPVADPEVAVVEMAEPIFGTMKIELYSNIAPQMVERFKKLAKAGFYNGTTFHRVSGVVLQGGDPTGTGTGGSDEPDVPAEFSDVPFERGMVGAARTQDPNSANCQFYITLQRYPSWDRNYTVFGKVIEGMNNASTISGVPKNGERPLDKVIIKSITIQPK